MDGQKTNRQTDKAGRLYYRPTFSCFECNEALDYVDKNKVYSSGTCTIKLFKDTINSVMK